MTSPLSSSTQYRLVLSPQVHADDDPAAPLNRLLRRFLLPPRLLLFSDILLQGWSPLHLECAHPLGQLNAEPLRRPAFPFHLVAAAGHLSGSSPDPASRECRNGCYPHGLFSSLFWAIVLALTMEKIMVKQGRAFASTYRMRLLLIEQHAAQARVAGRALLRTCHQRVPTARIVSSAGVCFSRSTIQLCTWRNCARSRKPRSSTSEKPSQVSA